PAPKYRAACVELSEPRNAAVSFQEGRNPRTQHWKARHRSKIPLFQKMNLTSNAEVARSIKHPWPPHGSPQDRAPAFFVSSTTTQLYPAPGYRINAAPSEAHPGAHRRGSRISASGRGASE